MICIYTHCILINNMLTHTYTLSYPIQSGGSTADVDLYISLSGEPGRSRYDFKSDNYGSEIDSVHVTCSSGGGGGGGGGKCAYYIAVYGYKGGEFTITVSTQDSITRLQTNQLVLATVQAKAYNYYSFPCTNQYAVLTFILSITSGDADLYINTHRPNTTLTVPTTAQYIWRSIGLGSDTIIIGYNSDPLNYCYNCEYIIGVNGYKNSSYSILVIDTIDTIIRLTNSRPQVLTLPTANSMVSISIIV